MAAESAVAGLAAAQPAAVKAGRVDEEMAVEVAEGVGAVGSACPVEEREEGRAMRAPVGPVAVSVLRGSVDWLTQALVRGLWAAKAAVVAAVVAARRAQPAAWFLGMAGVESVACGSPASAAVVAATSAGLAGEATAGSDWGSGQVAGEVVAVGASQRAAAEQVVTEAKGEAVRALVAVAVRVARARAGSRVASGVAAERAGKVGMAGRGEVTEVTEAVEAVLLVQTAAEVMAAAVESRVALEAVVTAASKGAAGAAAAVARWLAAVEDPRGEVKEVEGREEEAGEAGPLAAGVMVEVATAADGEMESRRRAARVPPMHWRGAGWAVGRLRRWRQAAEGPRPEWCCRARTLCLQSVKASDCVNHTTYL